MAEEQQKKQKSPGENSDAKRSPKGRLQHPVVYIISIIVLLIIAVTFVAGPSLNIFSPQAENVSFGSIYGNSIEYTPGSYFAQQQQALAQEFAQSGQDASIQTIYQIWRIAFQRTLLHYAFLEEAKNSGFRVTQEAVDKAMAQNPRFFENGEFSPERYRSVSNVERLQLRETTHAGLIHQEVINSILQAAQPSDPESDFIARMGADRRSFTLARFPFAEYPAEEIIAFAQESPDTFRVREISSITLNSREEAQVLLERIKAEELNFQEAAQEYSTDGFAAQGGSRGAVIFYDFQAEFSDEESAESIFSADRGSLTDIVETRNGRFGFYRLDSEIRSLDPESDREMQRVRGYISRFDSQRIEDYFRSEADSFLLAAQNRGFVAAAQEGGISTVKTNEFPINYGSVALFPTVQDAEGNQIAGTGNNEEFFLELFSLEDQQISKPIALGGEIIVAQLNSTRTVEEEELNYLKTFAGYIIQDWLGAELERVYLDPEVYTDRFDQAFQQLVMGN